MHNSVPYMKTSLCANVQLNSTNFDFDLKSSLAPFFHQALIKFLQKLVTMVDKLNAKKILAVINATYAVAERKPEKIRLARIRTLTSAIPVQRSNQLS